MAWFNYVFGPRLYMEYGLGSQRLYEARGLEKYGDSSLLTLSLMWNITYYSSPLIVAVLFLRGYLVTETLSSLAKFGAVIGFVVCSSLLMRGFGRWQSPSYARMVRALELSRSASASEEEKQAFRRFDFEFGWWQVDFDVGDVQTESKGKPIRYIRARNARPLRLTDLPCKVAAYIAMHSFGIHMLYPGSVKLLQSQMRPMLVVGRAKLIEEENATRYKIKTIDRNEIDTLFIDNRRLGNNGKTLVICTEGNSGFYEIGIMETPVEMHYSVIGWNHPGFGGSTGLPYPDQDKNAIEAVVQFAVCYLNFAVEDILLYGWSIGGFTTLWAATCYPGVKGIVLDATFDDVVHLALPRMPASMSGVVKIAIRDYCNLNLIEMIPDYNGPVLLIRRMHDEVISEDRRLKNNRGNYLGCALLKYRYPNIFKETQINLIWNMLKKPINSSLGSEDYYVMRLARYAALEGKTFPMQIGEDFSDMERSRMAVFLLQKHFQDFPSSHCTLLPGEFLNIPWDIPCY